MPLYIHNFELLMSNNRDELVKLLQDAPNSPVIGKLVSEVEENYPADLNRDSELLHGVWDLRWSSSTQPWLRQDRQGACRATSTN